MEHQLPSEKAQKKWWHDDKQSNCSIVVRSTSRSLSDVSSSWQAMVIRYTSRLRAKMGTPRGTWKLKRRTNAAVLYQWNLCFPNFQLHTHYGSLSKQSGHSIVSIPLGYCGYCVIEKISCIHPLRLVSIRLVIFLDPPLSLSFNKIDWLCLYCFTHHSRYFFRMKMAYAVLPLKGLNSNTG